MSTVSLHRKHSFGVKFPYWVFVNKQLIGILEDNDMDIEMPNGRYDIEVRILFYPKRQDLYVGGNKSVLLTENENIDLTITDKERWWNILFDMDLVLWMAEFFITLPQPWHIVYEVLSNGFFIIWIIRLWMIRKNFFKLEG